MFYKKFNKSYDKISANIPKDISKRLDEIAMFYLCSRSDIIYEALIDYIKKHDKKLERMEKQKRTI